MNTETYSYLRQDFLKALSHRRLLDAISILGSMNALSIRKIPTGKLSTIRENYHFLLENFRQALPDPLRSFQLEQLFAQVYELGAFLQRAYDMQHTHSQRSLVARTLKNMHEVPTQAEVLLGNHSPRMLFEVIWTGESWSNEENQAALAFLRIHRIAENEKLLLVAAVMLSLLHSFDAQRFSYLLSILENQWEATNMGITRRIADRALVALVFVIARQEMPLGFYPQLEERVRRLAQEPRLANRWLQLQRILLQSTETQNLMQQIETEILPQIEKHSGGALMGDRFDFQHIEEFVPQNRAELNTQELQKQFSMLLELQRSGADITFGSFRQIFKRLPFFKVAANWFAFFTQRHPEVARVQAFREQWSVVLKNKSNDSDRFAFVKYLEMMTTSGRGQQVEAADILMGMSQRRSEAALYIPTELSDDDDSYLRTFVQDCYRFFTLFAYQDYIDPFRTDKQLFLPDYGILAAAFANDQARENLIDFCHILEHHAQAERLLATLPDSYDRLKRRAICYQHLGQPDKAIPLYEKAFLLDENEEILRALVDCCLLQGDTKQALTHMLRLEVRYPQDMDLLKKLVHCLLQHGRFEEALERLHKADYLSPDSTIYRLKAWTLLNLYRYDEAVKYYDRLLAESLHATDLFHAAHAQWLLGNTATALVLYGEYLNVKQQAVATKAFFETDTQLLLAHGLTTEDLRLMIDLINIDR